MKPEVARKMWHATEPLHAVVYFAPEAKASYAAAGLKGAGVTYPNPMGLPPSSS